MQSVSARFHVLKKIKRSRALAVLDTLAHGKRKHFPQDIHMYKSVHQVCFTLKKHNLCLLQLDWNNTYLERGGEEREAKVANIFQMIAFRIADELRLRNMQMFCLEENTSKLSFSSKIPFISHVSGGSYDVVCFTGRNKIKLSDIYTKGIS